MLLFLSLVSLLFHQALAAYLPELIHFDNGLAKRAAASTSSTSPSTPTAPADSQCTNGPATRSCWGNGYSIATNYDAVWPTTGKTVEYTIEIQNRTLAPDGFSRRVYAINGLYPGPTITANWGDKLKITVKNSLTTNGTSIHWHGLRQWQTNQMDGTNGVTECPLAPGQSRTYEFLCAQFGTTWYHSHFSSQYSDGVVGTIIINGPTTSNYDYDLGTYPITDWYHRPAFEIGPLIQTGGFPRGPPPADNILINGTNVGLNGTGGRYSRTTIAKGKKYKLRLINTSTNDNFKVSLDGHNFTVVSADFVPLNRYSTQYLFIGIGQRYDVIIEANQAVDNYWFHVVPVGGCSNNLNSNAVAIFTYQGANSTGLPSSASRNNGPTGAAASDCTDPNSQLIPYVKLDVPSNYTIPESSRLDVGFAIVQNQQQQTLFQWNLNFTAMSVQWDHPTLEYVLNKSTNYPPNFNLITLPKANAWSYWVIQAIPTIAPPVAHPIHLHGHDFYVLGAGVGIYNNSQTLNYKNPPRRDVAMLPASGYLVLAFITDNPGAWLMHCHIAWHVGLGLAAQFVERADDIPKLPGVADGLEKQCNAWDAYNANAIFHQEDSGLKRREIQAY
ncbi:laccase, multicopper oxidase, benzenediol:oxygen oxidorectuctase [Cladophialophora chaetospira]|uniref:laccase n=1 Tax=Cladophialophora chaetospira TaxID=386627 RepID=A0AA38X830_9EURO|nr:laccase, multicopper oxidase, benzenediol:oxygen oxidorectuctase [Cladophialophora chaetospira]